MRGEAGGWGCDGNETVALCPDSSDSPVTLGIVLLSIQISALPLQIVHNPLFQMIMMQKQFYSLSLIQYFLFFLYEGC